MFLLQLSVLIELYLACKNILDDLRIRVGLSINVGYDRDAWCTDICRGQCLSAPIDNVLQNDVLINSLALNISQDILIRPAKLYHRVFVDRRYDTLYRG